MPANPLAWPAWATNFVLQQTDAGVASRNWTNVTGTVGVTNNEAGMTVPINGETRFYRLFKQ